MTIVLSVWDAFVVFVGLISGLIGIVVAVIAIRKYMITKDVAPQAKASIERTDDEPKNETVAGVEIPFTKWKPHTAGIYFKIMDGKTIKDDLYGVEHDLSTFVFSKENKYYEWVLKALKKEAEHLKSYVELPPASTREKEFLASEIGGYIIYVWLRGNTSNGFIFKSNIDKEKHYKFKFTETKSSYTLALEKAIAYIN